MKMTRRVLALLLALCLTFGNVMPAMATGLEGEEPAVTEEITPVVPEVEETEAPAEAEETKAPVAEVTEAPVVETEAPVVETEAPVEETEALVEETIAQIVDEAANATATATISFANKAQRTSFSTSSQVWEQNGITVTNNKGGSSSNVADYANPARFYKSSELIIAYPGMTKIEFTANSGTYATSLKNSLAAAGYSATVSSSVVTLTLSGVDMVSFTLSDGQVRMDSLAVYADSSAGGDTCEHEWDEGVVTAATCFADGYTTYTCILCGETKTGDVVAAGHKYEGDVCTVCGDGTVLTIAEAITKGSSTGNSLYTQEKYRVTGKITEVYNTSYGNMYITDGNGNTLTVYGTYSANGATHYDKMDPQPVAGDTITVYGIIGNYNGTPQMKDGWIVAHTPAGSEPEVTEPEVTEPEVTEPEVTEPTPSEPSEVISATLSFANTANRTEGTTSKQVWSQNGVTLTNSGSVNPDYFNPVRLYKNSVVKIEFPGLNKIVFACYNASYATALKDSISIGTVTVDGTTVTLELDEAVNYVELTMSAGQVRLNSIEVFGTGKAVEDDFVRPETPAEIVAAAYALADGENLKDGPYTLTGVITAIDEEGYSTEYENITVTMVVEGKEIGCYRMKGTGADTLAVGDTITVTGNLTNYKGSIQFAQGCGLDAVVKPEVINVAFDFSGTNWSSVDAYLCDAAGSSFRIDLVKTESGVCYFGVDEYFPLSPAEIVSIGFCEHAGGGYTNIVAYENGKTYSAADFTITDESITVYWDNSVTPLNDVILVLSCAHGGETGPIETHFGEWGFVKSVNGDIYEFEIPACTAGHTIWFDNEAFTAEDGMTYPQCIGRPGTEKNPEAVIFAWNENGSSATASVTIPAASTYYISFATGRGFMAPTMELYADDVYVGSYSGTDFAPAVVGLTNESEEAVTVALRLSHPVGSQMNPDTLWSLGINYTSVEAGDSDGYYYTYTIEQDGTLNITTVDNGIMTDVVVEKVVNDIPVSKSLLMDGVDGVLTYDVAAGDVLTIQVVAVQDAAGNYYPAAEIEWNINYPAGSALNPIAVQPSMGFGEIESSTAVTIPAHTTYYVAVSTGVRGGEMLLTIDEEEYGIINAPNWQPLVLELVNDSDEEITKILTLAFPAGSQMNPANLSVYTEGESLEEYEGNNVATVSEGSWSGYLYTWYAPKAGELTVSFNNGKAGWAYTVNNMTSWIYGDSHASYDEPNVNTETIIVNAGDEIQIIVNSAGESYADTTPAGEIHFYAYFNPTVGTAENPIDLTEDLLYEDDFAATVTVPAGQTYYFCAYRVGGMFMSINGGEVVECVAAGMWSPYAWNITNDGEADAEYVITVAYPVGNQMNPAELVIGENSCEIEENSNGYTYKWIAEADGDLTITMGDNVASWSYVVNNLTNLQYGETYSSNDEVVTASQTIPVAAGDEIQITINTAYDWEAWSSPAGTVTFTAAFEIPLGYEGNPEMITFEMSEDGLRGYYSHTIPANTTYYFQAYGIGGMQLTIEKALYDENGEYMDHECVDQYTLPGGNPRMPVTFAVTNDGDVDAEFALSVEWLAGSQMNPVAFGYTTDISDYISIEEGNTSGYHYTMTAPIDGTAEFYLDFACNPETGEDVAADINVFNLNTNEMKTMSEDGVDGCLLMDVSAEDELQINVVTQPDADWTYPAAEIAWRMFFTRGTEQNPERMNPGKNSVKIEANDEDGVYFVGGTESSGYVTITMTSKNWEYQVGNLKVVEDEEGNAYEQLVWGDVQASNAGGAKSQTIPVRHGNFFLRVNTADKKAGTVSFNITHVSKEIDLISGKSTTLTFTDPKTGKAIAGSKVNWELSYGDDAYATLTTAGKLTAAAGIEEPTTIYVLGTLKADEDITNEFIVTIRPATASIQINKGHVENVWVEETWNEEYGDWEGGYHVDRFVAEEENITELTYVIGDEIELMSVIDPDAALQEVIWKSSNTNILKVNERPFYNEYGKNKAASLSPVHNPKTGKVGTGSVVLTATAADGSGIKATVKVNVVLETREINVYTKNYQWLLTPGKSLTMVADLRTGYNQAPTNKNVAWEIAEMYVMDYETYSWAPYVPAEGEAPIITISNKGVVKAASNVDKIYKVVVKGTAQDTGVFGTASFYVGPQAKTGEIVNVPATYDLNVGREIRPDAVFFDKNGNEAFTGYKWTTSNKSIMEVVQVEEQNENGDWFTYDVLSFKGKTGKVTLTATATDGSGKKATAVINVVKAPNEVRIDTSASVAAVGKTATLKATPGYYDSSTEEFSVASDKTVIWSFHEDDAELVAAVGAKLSNGKVTVNAKKFAAYIAENELNWVDLRVVATAKLTNVEGEEVSAEAYVTFLPATTKVTMERFNEPVSGTVTIDDDDYVVLHAESAPETALDEYKWTTSNAKVATIEYNPDGSVTVRPVGKLGTAVIKATAMDGTNKSAQVTVKVVKKVDTLTIAEGVGVATTKSINLNKSLTINPTNASNKKVTWSWADEQSAAYAKELKVTLNASGTLSAAKLKTISKPITLNVKVTAADGFGAVTTAPVTIYPATTKVELRPANSDLGFAKTVTINVNDTPELYITAVGTPEGLVLDQYKWTSSNAKIATVDQYGKVTFTGKVGSVNIRATAQDGTNKYAQVTFKLVKAVQEVSIPEDTFLGIAKGKTVTLSKSLVIAPADASNKNMTWSMELVEPKVDENGDYVYDENGYVVYQTKGDGIVPKTMATLNANTGALKCVNVTEREYVKVTFTAKDGFGASGSAIVVLAPSAVKGLKVMAADFAEEFAYADLVDYTKKTYTTTSDAVMLYPEVTNYSDQTASGQTFTVNNKNFQVEWEMVTEVYVAASGETKSIEYANPVVRPVEGAANPYGTVKVTMKTTDGGNVSSYITIKFVQPEPAT